MAVSKKKVQCSTNDVNDYGFVVFTPGIDMSRFERNPVMLYAHDPNRLIGKWEKIEKTGDSLSMFPNFNSKNAFAAEKEQEFEDGFLNAVSVGVRPPYKWENGDKYGLGADTLVLSECVLYEVSMLPMGSNANAIVLADDKGKAYTPDEIKAIQLSAMNNSLQNQTDMKFKELLIAQLGLAANATDADIETALKNLKAEHVALTAKKAEWETLEADKKELAAAKIEIELNAAVAAGKITEAQKPVWKGQLEANFAGTKTLLDSLAATAPTATKETPVQQPVKLTAQLNEGVPTPTTTPVELKTITDYYEKGKQEDLKKMKKENRQAYIQLCAASGIDEKEIDWNAEL